MTLKALAINLMITTLVIAWLVLLVLQVHASFEDDMKSAVGKCFAEYQVCMADNPLDTDGVCSNQFNECQLEQMEKLGYRKIER